MAETCIFCGSEGESFPPEHWVPDWISRSVVGPNRGVEHHDLEGNVWYGTAFDLTVGRVCPDCNHHWMSDIEGKVRRLALPLIKGDRISLLPQQDQRLLSVWSYMKVITLEIGRPADEPRTYPDFVYEGFCEHKRPPDTSCAVSVGRREIPDGDPYVWFRSQGRKYPSPVGELNGYRTALTIGHFVIDVIGVLDGRAVLGIEDEDPRLTRIWPVTTRPVSLPPDSFKGIKDNDLI